MIIQIGTEVDESRILWKHKESDEWKRADVDDLIEAYENRQKGEWIFNPKDAIDLMFTLPKCSKCGFESADCRNFCPNCGAYMKGDAKNG